MSRCKCTDGDSRGGVWLVRGHQFFSEKHFLFQSALSHLSEREKENKRTDFQKFADENFVVCILALKS